MSPFIGVGIRVEDDNAAAFYFGCSSMINPFEILKGDGWRFLSLGVQRWSPYVEIFSMVFNATRGNCVDQMGQGNVPRTCSSVADWLRISSGSYAAGGIYHGRPLVHMLIGLIGSIPSD
ncbi:hypothetical protein Tco_1137764 [Tanacetum coccineum]